MKLRSVFFTITKLNKINKIVHSNWLTANCYKSSTKLINTKLELLLEEQLNKFNKCKQFKLLWQAPKIFVRGFQQICAHAVRRCNVQGTFPSSTNFSTASRVKITAVSNINSHSAFLFFFFLKECYERCIASCNNTSFTYLTCSLLESLWVWGGGLAGRAVWTAKGLWRRREEERGREREREGEIARETQSETDP